MHIKSEIGPFSIVPEWVLDRDLSSTALKLYIVLGRFADWRTGVAFPARDTLAERMGCSSKTIDRAVDELVTERCIEKQSRGRYASAVYTVLQIDPLGTKMSTEWTKMSFDETNLSEREDKNVHITITNEQEPINEILLNERARTISDSWTPNENVYELEKYSVLDIDKEAESFVLFHTAKGTKYKNWDAAFRKWLNKGLDFYAEKHYKENAKDQEKARLDAWLAEMEDDNG